MRSPYRGNAYNAFIVNASGNVNNNNANNGNRVAPDFGGFMGIERLRAALAARTAVERSRAPEPERAEPRCGDAPILRDAGAVSVAGGPFSFDALWDSMLLCKRGVMWKPSVSSFVLNGPQNIARLAEDVDSGAYRQKPVRSFQITSPKRRDIVAVPFRDRVYQRSLNDNVVFPAMSRSWIYDNCASQPGKGTDFARERLKRFLREHYALHGQHGWVLQVDIAGYYPNMPHATGEAAFGRGLSPEDFARVVDVLGYQYEGEVGYNAGSQMVQIMGLSVLDPVDHMVKERLRMRRYIRYMDDMVLISADKDELKRALQAIRDRCEAMGLKLHPGKTRIRQLSAGIEFLGFRFRLTASGKVAMNVLGKKVKQQKRHLKGLVRLAKAGGITKEKCDECYQGWKAHAGKGDSWKLLRRMDAYYESLWKESS